MYTVFLVEDEFLIRNGIKELIEWNEYGFSFVGEAADGELAWPLIQKQKPDIVITDIKMPFMDGLSLSRLIKKELPQTTIIILSGHDDFSYAKEAISIGVAQYLLKPVSKDQLTEILCHIKKQKDTDKEQSQYSIQFNQELQEYLTSSRRGFFDILISGKQTVSEILERAEKMKLTIVSESYNIILFLLEEGILQNKYSAQLADLQNDLCTHFPETKNLLMFSISIDSIVFLVMADAKEIEAKTKEYVNKISSICQPIQNVNWSVVVGKPVYRLSAVSNCYRSVRNKMFHCNSAYKNNIYYVGEPSPDSDCSTIMDFDPNAMDAAKMDQRIIEKFLTNGLSEDIPSFVSNYFNTIGAKTIESMLFRQYVVLNIQFTVNAFLKKLQCEKENNFLEKTELSLQKALLSLEESEKYVKKLLSYALTLRDNTANNRYSSMLKNVLDFMNENYSNPNISLNIMAEVANMSAAHFSAVFSQQMGKTFVEYLTETRMNKARELLRCTDKSSGDIAFDVGYNDPHYFSFLFKKINGCSPRDYRLGRNSS